MKIATTFLAYNPINFAITIVIARIIYYYAKKVCNYLHENDHVLDVFSETKYSSADKHIALMRRIANRVETQNLDLHCKFIADTE